MKDPDQIGRFFATVFIVILAVLVLILLGSGAAWIVINTWEVMF